MENNTRKSVGSTSVVLFRRLAIAWLVLAGIALGANSHAVAQFAADDAEQQAIMAVPLQKSREAIEKCRERRLKKELANYWESALCSNLVIFSVWQEAKYPYMDLIAIWLNARMSGSRNVDKGLTTSAEFERQMGELTNRLTIEERRRRSYEANLTSNQTGVSRPTSDTYLTGLAALQDSESPPQNVDNAVAEKKAEVRPKKATNATPQRAPKAGASVARSNIPRSNAEPIAASQEATSGIGGPYVPAVYVQVSAQRNEKDAVQAARVLQASFPNIVGRVSIMRADLGTRGIYYRAHIGPFTPEQADRVCNSLKVAGGDCFVPRNN